ncbi:unnamed protein product, partial [Mesorhabditis spiculigera]
MKRPISLENLTLLDEKGDLLRKWREPTSKALRASQIEMKSSSLPDDDMTAQAIQFLADALDKGGIENDIATFMKTQFETKYGNNWNCIM